MCWGLIGYEWKGPFHVWDPETEEEKQKAESEILYINTEMEEEAEMPNATCRNSAEWATLWLQELATAQVQHQAENIGAPKKKVDQIWWCKKFKVEKLLPGEYIHGVDAWRYVKHVVIPLMWPECHHQLQQNPDFVLMEDGASPHTASYTSCACKTQWVPKLDWVSNSPDCNPIELIWTLMKRRIQWGRASEKVTTVTNMKLVPQE